MSDSRQRSSTTAHGDADRRVVSVCMLAYNHARFVAEALDSVLAQRTRHRIEIVVGDDYSSDGTGAILAGYASRHPGIISVIRRERNLGMMRNLVDVFARCRGDYICLLECDDRWTCERKVERQVAYLEAHPGCAICFHDSRIIHEDGSRDPTRFPGADAPRFRTLGELIRRNFMQTASVMYRGGLLRDPPEWLLGLGLGDWPFHLLHAQHGYIAYLPVPMSDYRVHAGGIWSTQSVAAQSQRVVKACHRLTHHFAPRYSHELTLQIVRCHSRLSVTMERGEWLRQGRLVGIGFLRNRSPRHFFFYHAHALLNGPLSGLRSLCVGLGQLVRGAIRP